MVAIFAGEDSARFHSDEEFGTSDPADAHCLDKIFGEGGF